MNKQIVEHVLTVDTKVNLTLPKGAEVLSVMVHLNKPVLNVLVDVDQDYKETRIFEVFKTGHVVGYDMGVERKYIGTVQINNGDYVAHVFERNN